MKNSPWYGTAQYNAVFRCEPRLVTLAEGVIARAVLTPVAGKAVPRVFTGRISTGDRVVWKEETVQKLTSRFGGLCVEMEGAAVAQVCLANETPWVVNRSISDLADANVIEDFAANQDQVCRNLARMVRALVPAL